VLGQSLDYTTTLAAVARLAVPEIADWCSIHMLAEDGSIMPLAVAHVDPQKVALAEQLQAKYPPVIDAPTGVPNVLRTGTSELYREIDDELLSAAAQDERHLQILRELGLVSAMIVPLVARGRTLGAIALVSAESGKHFDADDLLLAEDLARRAAAAVDNAMLYRSVQREKEAAEAANNAKDQFLAMLSHELRTPLTPVLITIQVMQRDRQLPDEVRSDLELIRRNVELEARLIDDLLDLTRISKGKLQLDLQPVDAHRSIRDALEICCAEADEKGLKVELDLSARGYFVRADSARLQQVFWNLLKNAIKFTPSGGHVRITTSNDEAGRLRVAVSDTGIGIEPPALARIFDAFEQGAPAITRQFGGLGLGLAISKALIDMHGGSLSASSAGKDRGSTFTITLATVGTPMESRNGDDPRQRETPEQRAVRILMVDDHEDTSRALKRLLSRLGYEVLTADSMRSALTAAEAGPFDLLISDIGLPDGSGHELMRQLLARQPIKGIALSGFGMEEDIRKSKEAGFREHLTKPINLAKLQAVIRELVRT
jgi:signal transduction histidine kinase/CheY-like chemotaxis protein